MQRSAVVMSCLSMLGCSVIFDPADLRGEPDAGANDGGRVDATPPDSAVELDGGVDGGVDGGPGTGSDAGPLDASCGPVPAPPVIGCGPTGGTMRLASAELTSCGGGVTMVTTSSWLAWRFSVPAGATTIVGAGFHGRYSGEIFAALLPLSGESAVPAAPPAQMSFDDLIGCAVPSAGVGSVELRFMVPVSVVSGGWYAIIIGTDAYGVGAGNASVTHSTVPADEGLLAINVGVDTTAHGFASRLFVDFR